jgi:hypothetical protein
VLLTHLMSGTPAAQALACCRAGYDGDLAVASPGQVVDLA